MASIDIDLTLKVTSIYYAPAEPEVGIFNDELLVEEIEVWDGDKRLNNPELENYLCTKYQEALVAEVKKEKEEF